jgi:hippurate hydrolase
MTNPIEAIGEFQDELVAIRRDLHAHPELGFEEHRTSQVVAELLASWGIEVHRGVGRTGVVGVLRGGNGAGSVGLRADMDALPIHEMTGVAHASSTPGVMHACGHDGHTAMLLGAARYLAATKRFNGTVNFIFQPAEEGIGGARAMLADDLFGRFRCDSVFGMHNHPGLAVGEYAIRPGAMMAGGGFFDLTVTGVGTHGARPEAGVDPVLVAAHVVTALQSVVSRNVAPIDAAVLSCTAIEGGQAYNVVPDRVAIRGTIRAFRTEVLELLERNMRRVAESVASGLGASASLEMRTIFAPLVNDPVRTAAFADAAASLVGEAAVERNRSVVMGSEDFAFMMEAVPGAYINVGNGESASVHNAGYDFNDAAIPYGAGLYAAIVERELARGDAG